MVWGGAHFIIREADYKKSVHRPKLYYDSIKYKIINNNPYNLIHLYEGCSINTWTIAINQKRVDDSF